MASAGLRILEGGRSTVQDLGRSGMQAFGVPVRGSPDQYASRMALALVVNDPGLPLIEVTALDLAARAETDLLVAVTGAHCDLTIDGHPAPLWQPVVVRRGSEIRLSRVRQGLRCYLAVHGRIEAPELLGSVSPDPSLEFGWRLTAGDVVPVESGFSFFDHPHFRHPLIRPAVSPRSFASPHVVTVTAGPDVEQFDSALTVLQEQEYDVGAQSDEVGLQIRGVVPERRITSEILSRGVAIGAIEVTPSGDLLALLRGRMLTAGYPVVAVATTTAQSILGQAQPGDRIRFRLVDVEAAVRSAREERREIDQVAAAVRRIFASLAIEMPGRGAG